MLKNVEGKLSSVGSSIIKGATTIGEGVKQGAVTFSESVQLNAKIDAANKTMEKAYKEIGEKFYNDNAEEVPADFDYAERFAIIKEQRTIILEAKAALEALSSAKKCKSCGADLLKGAEFCTKCGQKINEDAEPVSGEVEEAECTKCGAKLDAGAAFCHACGTPVEK